MNREIITVAARKLVKDFLEEKYQCTFTENYYDGLDNKTYGDYCYTSGNVKINVDYKYSTYNNGKISLELTDYKKETWLLNDNINYICFETPTEIVIVQHQKMKQFAKNCIEAKYSYGDFFNTSTHLCLNPHFKEWSVENFKEVTPLKLLVPEMLVDFIQCHCSKQQGCLVSVSTMYLAGNQLTEKVLEKRRIIS